MWNEGCVFLCCFFIKRICFSWPCLVWTIIQMIQHSSPVVSFWQADVPSWMKNTRIYRWPSDTQELVLRLLREERYIIPQPSTSIDVIIRSVWPIHENMKNYGFILRFLFLTFGLGITFLSSNVYFYDSKGKEFKLLQTLNWHILRCKQTSVFWALFQACLLSLSFSWFFGLIYWSNF